MRRLATGATVGCDMIVGYEVVLGGGGGGGLNGGVSVFYRSVTARGHNSAKLR